MTLFFQTPRLSAQEEYSQLAQRHLKELYLLMALLMNRKQVRLEVLKSERTSYLQRQMGRALEGQLLDVLVASIPKPTSFTVQATVNSVTPYDNIIQTVEQELADYEALKARVAAEAAVASESVDLNFFQHTLPNALIKILAGNMPSWRWQPDRPEGWGYDFESDYQWGGPLNSQVMARIANGARAYAFWGEKMPCIVTPIMCVTIIIIFPTLCFIGHAPVAVWGSIVGVAAGLLLLAIALGLYVNKRPTQYFMHWEGCYRRGGGKETAENQMTIDSVDSQGAIKKVHVKQELIQCANIPSGDTIIRMVQLYCRMNDVAQAATGAKSVPPTEGVGGGAVARPVARPVAA
ncbi:MAG TPA: hypothetical protein VJB02_01295 [Coxiellaceae bacterium]|nr:hypothetical protein [Coxiellaceae bacterium]